MGIRPRVRIVLSLTVDRGANATEQLPLVKRPFEGDDTTPVPSDLGRGEVFLEAGWLYWRCDSEKVLIDLDILDSAEAPRKPRSSEVIAMLDVAQERYAQLADCEVRPPPE